jgi:NADPH2:quinone reductase
MIAIRWAGDNMQAWFCDQPTGPQALRWAEAPTPEPGPGQIRIAIRAASLNFPDLLVVSGKYQFKPEPPFVPGSEFAGLVDAIGTGVSGFEVGQPVAAFAGTGGFGSHACVDSRLVLPLPPGFDLEDASAFICTYGTSHHGLVDRAELKAGETVLVLGAAGGVGTAAIQVAKTAGARVIAAVSSERKLAACKAIGADEAFNYTSADVRERLKSLTDGRGPDVVFDPVGGDLAEPVFRSLAWRGRYLVIGFAQGRIPALPLNLALLKGTSLVGVFWGEYARREPQHNAQALAQLAGWYAAGRIKPVIDQRLPMQRLPDAFARMAARDVIGKLVMVNA